MLKTLFHLFTASVCSASLEVILLSYKCTVISLMIQFYLVLLGICHDGDIRPSDEQAYMKVYEINV